MKILHFAESFASGTRQIVQLLANSQVKEGHNVHVWHGVNKFTPCSAMSGFEASIESWAVPFLGSRNAVGVAGAVGALISKRKKRFDIVHLHSSVAGLLGRVLLASIGRVYIYTPHGSAFLQSHRSARWHWMMSCFESVAYRVCPTITVACSESEGEVLKKKSQILNYV